MLGGKVRWIMWTRQLLKENAKVAFKRNYWLCVAVSAIAMFLMGGGLGISGGNTSTQEVEDIMSGQKSLQELIAQIPPGILVVFAFAVLVGLVLGVCVSILVSNVAQVGCKRYFLENREHKTKIGQVFYGFQGGRYTGIVWIMFLKSLYIFLWSLLFLIPGIIQTYAYMMVPYIVAENSNLDKRRVFAISSKMMRGHKWEAFELGLSFLGWILLGAFTGGILNILYVNPYMHATYAEFYSAVKAEALQKGIVTPEELPGVMIPEVEIPIV